MVKKILFIAFLLITFLSFSQEKSIEKLIASPNPFVDATYISFESNKQQNVYLTVKNVLGKTVFNKEIRVKNGKNAIRFKRGNLHPGIYIYAVRSQNEMLSKRLVIR